MYCEQCGQSVPTEAKFCRRCGSKIGSRDQEEPSTFRPSTPAAAIHDSGPAFDAAWVVGVIAALAITFFSLNLVAAIGHGDFAYVSLIHLLVAGGAGFGYAVTGRRRKLARRYRSRRIVAAIGLLILYWLLVQPLAGLLISL